MTDQEFKEKVSGRIEREVLETLFQKKLTEDEVENYSNQRIDVAIEQYRPHLALTPGLREFLDDLKSSRIPTGVATSTQRVNCNIASAKP